jgi:outer membrane protein assembly factor BamD
MTRFSKSASALMAALLVLVLAGTACGFKRKKYENPISKETQQPDKVLFDKAVNDIEHGRYEIARLTLNTLINTYDTSEYLAKAKLAVADSWYREGGTHGLSQAEAEYKDFILFYPAMEEAAESQEKICMIHYKQMEKADRDPNNALRAEQECRQLVVQFPNSKFVPEAEQRLREIQEVLAGAEMMAGDFYHHKGSNAAAANRLGALVDQYPLFSQADLALWEEADSYSRMGPRFRQKNGDALAKIVKEYPLSPYADLAKKKLQALELPVPDADPAAAARMKYEAANRVKPGLVQRYMDPFGRAPDMSAAAKTGTPTMTNPKAQIPASVPAPAGAAGVSDVTVSPVNGTSALDTNPDARAKPPTEPATPGAAAAKNPDPQAVVDAKTAKDAKNVKQKKQKKQKNPPAQPVSTQPDTTAPAAAQPAATTPQAPAAPQ